MKILYVLPNLKMGGTKILIYEMIRSLKKSKDIEIEVLILSKENPKDFHYSQYNSLVKLTFINVNKIKGFRFFQKRKKVQKFIKDNKYDIIHTNGDKAVYLTAKFVSKKSKMKYIHTQHNPVVARGIIKNLIFKKMLVTYDKIIAISKAVEISIPLSKEKIKLIYNGIDLETFNIENIKNKKLDFIDENKINLLMVGRFENQKDQKTVIRAMNLLEDNYNLIFAGDGSKIEEAKELTKKLKLEDRIMFLGNRNDIPLLTSKVDISIISSFWEGFGLVAVEAMSLGKPVIGTNIPGLNEVICRNDMMFDVRNVKELVGIIKSLESNKLYEEVSVYNKKRSELFSINEMMKKYLKIYKDTLNDYN